MRRAVSVFLGLLLVLRALLGDAMAMGLAPAPAAGGLHQAAATAALHTDYGSVDTGPAAQGGHSGGHPAAADSAAPAQHCSSAASDCAAEHPAGCSACGICHSSLSAPAGAPAAPVSDAGTPCPQRSTRFASAPAAPAIKPPIS